MCIYSYLFLILFVVIIEFITILRIFQRNSLLICILRFFCLGKSQIVSPLPLVDIWPNILLIFLKRKKGPPYNIHPHPPEKKKNLHHINVGAGTNPLKSHKLDMNEGLLTMQEMLNWIPIPYLPIYYW